MPERKTDVKATVIEAVNNVFKVKEVLYKVADGTELGLEATRLHRLAIMELTDLLAHRPGAIAALHELDK